MRSPVARWLDSLGFLTKVEYSLPWGTCDMVGVQLLDSQAKVRLASGLTKPIDALELIQLLELIPTRESKRAATVSRLKRRLAASRSPSQVDADVERLVARKLVSFVRKNHVQRNIAWPPLCRKIVAVELKLHRVSTALAQAQVHLAFAHESYVALPENVAKRISTGRWRQDFRRRRVGLLAVGSAGVRVAIVSRERADATRRYGFLRTQCIERFWTTWLTSNSSSGAEQHSPAVAQLR